MKVQQQITNRYVGTKFKSTGQIKEMGHFQGLEIDKITW